LNFKEILELIDKVAERGIGMVEVERAGTKVRIEGKSTQPQVIHSVGTEKGDAQASSAFAGSSAPSVPAAPAAPPVDEDAGLHIITSPIVGTFYRAPNPESEPFANIGDRVSKGKVLCIVEAMKLMNEIECDADGVLERIYPQNGQPVEYGEKLFALKV
jgi:acetyl-CoA carboxylase biotin carboxyl carrier protein